MPNLTTTRKMVISTLSAMVRLEPRFAAAQFVENRRPAASFYMVAIYSKVSVVKSPRATRK